MKVLLISPPFYRLMGSTFKGLNLGISYIASFLNSMGHDAVIYNADHSDSDPYLPQTTMKDNFGMYKNILRNINHRLWSEIEQVIRSQQPDFVGIQMYTATYKSAKIVANITKRINPDIKVVVGGTHPTLDPEETITHGDYDYLIAGEGEHSLCHLLDGLPLSVIPGLYYKEGKMVLRGRERKFLDVNDLPFPERDNLVHTNVDKGYVITSRGCVYNCIYCASPKIWDRKVRFREIGEVVREVDTLVNDYGVKNITFQDDTFTLQRTRVVDLCNEFIDRQIEFNWACDTRVDRIDAELLSLMRDAGCNRIKIGVESGNDRVLRKAKKGIMVKDIRKAVKLIKRFNIPLTVYLMIGFPFDTDRSVRDTIALAKDIDADYNSLSIVTPYFGTELYSRMNEKPQQNWEYFFHQSKVMLMNNLLSPSLIDEFFELGQGKWGK